MEFSKVSYIGDGQSALAYDWAFAGGFITGTYWSGAVQLALTQNIPVVAAGNAAAAGVHGGVALDALAFQPSEAWQSNDRGCVVDLDWAPRHKKLIVGCEDGAILQLSPFSDAHQAGPRSPHSEAMQLDDSHTSTRETQREDDNPREEDLARDAPNPKRVKRNGVDTNQVSMEEMDHEEPDFDATVLYRHPHPVQVILCSNVESDTNLWVLSANSLGQIVKIDVNYASETSHSTVQWAHCCRITSLATKSDLIASSAVDGSLTLWDARLKHHGTQIGSNRDGLRRSYDTNDDFSENIWSSLAFSPDSQSLLLGAMDGSVLSFDLRQSRTPLMRFQDGRAPVRSISFKPASNTIFAYGSDDGCVRVVNSSKAVLPVAPQSTGARMPAFKSAGGPSADAIPSAELIYKYVHADQVRSVQWNPVSPSELISAGWDRIAVRHSPQNVH